MYRLDQEVVSPLQRTGTDQSWPEITTEAKTLRRRGVGNLPLYASQLMSRCATPVVFGSSYWRHLVSRRCQQQATELQILTPPPPQRPTPGGLEDAAWEARKSRIKEGSTMKEPGTQERSSGPYPSHSTSAGGGGKAGGQSVLV
ncbi:hypothetical protein ILYODFUR_039190 [Ilyodon furcidens]|uniref:Uncharacterized protein n=1 Tax=Ilyodon furcidens TaxID=33524 RepID=A0ABV0VKQ2_9TELE